MDRKKMGLCLASGGGGRGEGPARIEENRIFYQPSDKHEAARDCLGMTPLHILACSTKQNIDLYRILVADHPKSVIAADKWGCLPILYAIWGDSPPEIMELLIDCQKFAFPDFSLNWDGMVETLCRDGAATEIILKLLNTRQIHFPDDRINLQKAASELAICCLLRCDSLEDYFSIWEAMLRELQSDAIGAPQGYQELVQFMLGVQLSFFPEQSSTDLQTLCEDFVVSLIDQGSLEHPHPSLSTVRFLLEYDILGRLKTIGIRKWRMDIEELVRSGLSIASCGFSYLHTIDGRLKSFEREYHQLREAAVLLELAVWKSKTEQSIPTQCKVTGHSSRMVGHTDDIREQHHLKCGADVIIPNVVPFLMSK